MEEMSVQRVCLIAVSLLMVGGCAYWGARGIVPASALFGISAGIALTGACLPSDWI